MAVGVDFQGANFTFLAPAGMEGEVYDLHGFRDERCFVSCWRLSEDELAEVARTGVVWLRTEGQRFSPSLVSGTALVTIDGAPAKAEPVMVRVADKKKGVDQEP